MGIAKRIESATGRFDIASRPIRNDPFDASVRDRTRMGDNQTDGLFWMRVIESNRREPLRRSTSSPRIYRSRFPSLPPHTPVHTSGSSKVTTQAVPRASRQASAIGSGKRAIHRRVSPSSACASCTAAWLLGHRRWWSSERSEGSGRTRQESRERVGELECRIRKRP